MINIIKQGKIPQKDDIQIFEVTCLKCGCVFTCEDSDLGIIYEESSLMPFVHCPCCNDDCEIGPWTSWHYKDKPQEPTDSISSQCECYVEELIECSWGSVKRPVCIGTKERDRCSCGGDRAKCNFYESVRKKKH